MDINALLSELGEVESELVLLTERKDILRQEIAKVMAERNNEKLVVEGLGTVTVTKDRTSIKYDAKKLDAVVAQCLKDGNTRIATAISEARSETTSKGYLVIKKEW